jgi:hypothetical protein
MALAWKAEDEVRRADKDRGWRSAGERRAIKEKEGKKRSQMALSGEWTPKEEEISYPTVSCDDLPEEPPALPELIRERSAERGNYFRAIHGGIFSGPKTEEEAIKDQRIDSIFEREMERYRKYREEQRKLLSRNKQDRGWTPRWPGEEIDPAECIHLRVYSGVPGTYFQDVDLRRDWVWEDFRFLIDCTMKGIPWEAELEQAKWRKEDKLIPFSGQRVVIYPMESLKWIKKFEKWDADSRKTWGEYHTIELLPWTGMWLKPTVPNAQGGEDPTDGKNDYSILVQMPEESKNRLVKIPKGFEWPFFKQLMDNQIGEHRWVAGFASNGFDKDQYIWEDNFRIPLPGQVVFIHWLYGEEKRPEDPVLSATKNELGMQLFASVEEEYRQEMEAQMH